MLIDTHCHIDCADFNEDREHVIKRAYDLGVKKMMMIGVRASDWQYKLDLFNQYPGILYPVLGCHPLFISDHQLDDLDELERLIGQHPVTAIGEIGLDYYQKKPNIFAPDKIRQQEFFEKQLDLAQRYDLPVILHVRKAHDEVIKTLKKYKIVGGIAHAFNGSIQHAHQYVELGFKLGLGGMLTHPQSNKLRALFQAIELKDVVLETDAPDLTVFDYKGQRNSPEYLPIIAHCLAKLKNISYENIVKITTDNAENVLRLS